MLRFMWFSRMFCKNRLKNKEKTKVKTEMEQPLIPNVDTVYIETSHTLTGKEVDVQRVLLNFVKFDKVATL